MVFSSVTFIFYFLPVAIIVPIATYALLSKYTESKQKSTAINCILLFFSLLFYTWGEGSKIWILLSCIAISYISGSAIASNTLQDLQKKIVLIAGIMANLTFLGWFKYASFGQTTINKILSAFGATEQTPISNTILPLGISFFVFQSISYIIDVYQKHTIVCREPITFLSYITFFPQLVAGPIVRFKDIRTEISKRDINLKNLSEGATRFSFGLAKKVLIANQVGLLADEVFSLPNSDLGMIACWIGTIAYAIQILFDFSGYSDMAIGLSLMFGVHIPENFRSPYQAASIRDFWKRWHISLSSWFKDYVYIPLGGSKHNARRTSLNLFLVFFSCGLWHGAHINFIIWGLLHGSLISLEHFALIHRNASPNKKRAHNRAYCLFFVFSFWVVFRAKDPTQAFEFYNQMFIQWNIEIANIPSIFYSTETLIALISGVLISCIGIPKKWSHQIPRKPTALLLLTVSIMYISISHYNPFIYFRF